MLNHLVHRTILQELAVLVAVHAIIFVLTSIGIRTENFLCERHTAALTKLLFHTIFLFVINGFDGAKIHRMNILSKFLG
jgi:hypothetical protein